MRCPPSTSVALIFQVLSHYHPPATPMFYCSPFLPSYPFICPSCLFPHFFPSKNLSKETSCLTVLLHFFPLSLSLPWDSEGTKKRTETTNALFYGIALHDSIKALCYFLEHASTSPLLKPYLSDALEVINFFFFPFC